MTEQKPPRNGRDFAIGFFGSSVPATLLIVASGFGALNDNLGVSLFFAAIVISFIAILAGFIWALNSKRKYIALGIISSILAIPLLVFGSCFAIISGLNF